MSRFSIQKNLPYTAEQLFNLVADVKTYPEFIPGILKTKTELLDVNLLISEVDFGNVFYKDSYICQVDLIPFEKIKIQGLKGPFTYMDSQWEFTTQKVGSTLLNFTINFEFKSLLLKGLGESLFNKLTLHMIRAFETRAHDLYAA